MTIKIFVWDHKIKGKQKKKGALLGTQLMVKKLLVPIVQNLIKLNSFHFCIAVKFFNLRLWVG